MNPVTVEFLNGVEKYNRSKQVEALQLLNQAQAVRSSESNLLQKVVNRLGYLLTDPGQRLEEWTSRWISSDMGKPSSCTVRPASSLLARVVSLVLSIQKEN